MFLIDDDQAEIVKAGIGVQQPVGGDHDVDGAALQPVEHRGALAAGTETRQRLDAHRPVGEAVAEALQVLLRQQRGRHQHRHLAAGLHGDEGGAHRHLGLAEADVAAHHAVHGLGALHVLEHLAHRLGLIGGLLERKAVGEALILELAGIQRRRLMRRAARVQVEQLGGDVAHRLGGAAARACPLVGTELVQRRALGRAAGVAVHQMQRVHRHVDAIAVAIFERQEFAALIADFHQLQADIAADTVGLMHHRRPGLQALQVAQDGGRIRRGAAPPPALLACAGAEQLRFAEQQQRRLRQRQTGHVLGDADRQRGIPGCKLLPGRHRARAAAVSAEHLDDDFAPPGRVGGDQHAAGVTAEERGQRRQRLRGACIEPQLGRGGAVKIMRARRSRKIGAGKALDAHTGVGRERAGERRRLDEGLGRRQQRPLDIVPPVLVARADALPGVLECLADIAVARDHQLRRQVVGDLRCGVKEQRQVELDPGRRDAFADTAIDRHARDVALEARAIAAPECLDRLGIERQFACRQQSQLLDALERALRVGIEAADRVDAIIQQIHPHRLFDAHWKHIEQRAAQREFAGAGDLADAGIAG